MRILVVTHNFPFPAEKDGQTLIAFHLLQHLAKRHSVTLFCFGDKNDRVHQNEIARLGVTVRIFARPQTSLAKFYFKSVARRLAWYQYRLYSAELSQAIESFDRAKLADVIYLHSPMVSTYLNHVFQIPVVMGSIDAMSAWFKQFFQTEGNLLKRLHYYFEYLKSRRIERELFPKARRITVVSPVDQDIIRQQAAANRVTVVPNGVDTMYFRPSQTVADENMLIFSGTMNYPPNVKAVKRFRKAVWPRLKQLHPGLKWCIVGKNPTLEIFELPENDSSITVTGYVKDIRPFLWQSTIYISPLDLGTGFKNKIVEAMACGKAVIASSTSLSGFPITDGIHALRADTPDEFCLAIRELLEHPERRQEIERAARSFAEQYTWTRAAESYEHIFEEVAHASAS